MTLLDEKTPAHGKKASSVGKTKDKMK